MHHQGERARRLGKARTLPEAMIRGHSERPLVGAGFVVWMAAAVPQMAAWASGRACFEQSSVAWCAAYRSFAIAFHFAARTVRRGAWRAAALAGQSVAALVALAIGNTGFEGALLCIVAGESPLVVGEKTGFVWVIGQTVAMVAVDLLSPHRGRATHLSAFAYAGFQLFAFGASRLFVREAQARAELARVHAELLATRELFADSTRTAERLRIARELHDALGHHLTALNLQLELARNIADRQTKGPVDHAHALTKELLVELRSVVSAMREEAPLDLSGALQTLASGIPHPRVHLDFEKDLRVEATGSLLVLTTGTLGLLGIAGAAAIGSQMKEKLKDQQLDTLPPGAVADLALEGPPAADAAVISWSPVAGVSVKYTVQYSTDAGTTWLTEATTLDGPRFRLVGLAQGTSYRVRVLATNAMGPGISAEVPFTTGQRVAAPAGALGPVQQLALRAAAASSN